MLSNDLWVNDVPCAFKSLTNEVFRPILRKFVLVFVDDILVYIKDLNSHVAYLDMVLRILEKIILVTNKKKCHSTQET